MKTQKIIFAFLVCLVSSLAFGQIVSPSKQYDFGDAHPQPGKYETPTGGYGYGSSAGGSASYAINSSGSAKSASSYSYELIESSVVIYNSSTGETVYSNVFVSTEGEQVYFDFPVLADGEYTIQITCEDHDWIATFWINN